MKTRAVELSKGGMRIRLPVNPESIAFTEKQLNETVTLLNMGEVNLSGNRGLKRVKFTSFFPARHSPFYRYAKKQPKQYVKIIEEWKREGAKIRVIVTDLRINLVMLIDELSYSVKEGDKDVYYSISLSEYRKLNVPSVQMPLQLRSNGLQERPNTTAGAASRTVAKGDTLWGIAKAQYGNGAAYTKIYEANKAVIEAAAKSHGKSSSGNGHWIYPGTVLTLPV